MKTTKLILMTLVLLSTKSKLHSQTTPLLYTGFDNTTQQAGWTEYQLSGTIGAGWYYSTMNAYSPGTCAYQIYSTSADVDNWLVSPVLSLPAGGVMDSIRYMFNGLSTPGINDTIALYLLSGSQNPALATKTLLYDIRGTDYVNDGIYKKKTNVNLPSATGSCYFAIRYKCQQWVWLETRFDNLSLSANAPAPVATFSLSKTVSCKGESIKFTDLSTNNPTSWLWKFQSVISSAPPLTSTLTSPTITFTNSSAYTVTLTASNASGSSSPSLKTFTVNACTGLSEDDSNEPIIYVFPNPCTNELFISRAQENSELILSDLLGKQLYKSSTNQDTKQVIDMKNFPSGLYLLRVQTGNNSTTIKIVKE